MTQPLGIDDFFALEAGEYLERLAALVSGAAAPRPDELVRYARALRGSALMASQHAIARAAGGLEHVLRAYRDGRRGWDMETATLAASAVDELRDLVNHVASWSPDHAARAERLARRLESVAGPTAGVASSATNDAGVRAFLAREGATVASALDQAARALRGSTPGAEPMQSVLRRMQPLRGLAALSDFPPLAEILDGVERSYASLTGSGSALLPDLLDAAAQALARAARDVAEQGKPDPEAEECRRFAQVLLSAEPENTSVVPVEALFFDGEPGIVKRGTAPQVAPRVPVGEAELVSRGEHLAQVADELERAGTPTMQSLRLHSLAGTLRSLSEDVGESSLLGALEGFANAARAAIAEGSAALHHQEFAALLRSVGAQLRGASDRVSSAGIPAAIASLVGAVKNLGAVQAPAAPVAAVAPVAPAAAAAPAATVAALAPVAPLAPVVPIESLAPSEEPVIAAEEPGIAGSFVTYQRLLVQVVAGAPSIDALLGVGAPVPAPAPRAPTPAPAAPAPTPRVTQPVSFEPELAIVDIQELCYKGRGALVRAGQVRTEIRDAMASHAAGAVLRPLVEELLDLVDLAQVE